MISRPIVYVLLAAALVAGAAQYRAHVFGLGVAQESARRDGIDADRDRQARAALADANARVLNAQANLDGAMASLSKLQSELSHEKANSAALQSDLAAGRRRLSVAIVGAGACRAAAAEPGEGAVAAGLDQGSGRATVDLDGRAAADLEWMRQTRDEAITGLRACVAAYDAVRAAVDAK